MKNIIIGCAIFIFSSAACNDVSHKSSSDHTSAKDSIQKKPATNNQVASPGDEAIKSNAGVNEIVAGYLQIKNALADDNGNDAASGGNAIVEAMAKFDKSSLMALQAKAYEDVADDATEMADHIAKNADKIGHQREHFDMLSKDVYDLVKTFGAGKPLYQDFCPMYNDKKGATWLSETKEIKNPYLGQMMPTCGTVKEVIK